MAEEWSVADEIEQLLQAPMREKKPSKKPSLEEILVHLHEMNLTHEPKEKNKKRVWFEQHHIQLGSSYGWYYLLPDAISQEEINSHLELMDTLRNDLMHEATWMKENGITLKWDTEHRYHRVVDVQKHPEML